MPWGQRFTIVISLNLKHLLTGLPAVVLHAGVGPPVTIRGATMLSVMTMTEDKSGEGERVTGLLTSFRQAGPCGAAGASAGTWIKGGAVSRADTCQEDFLAREKGP